MHPECTHFDKHAFWVQTACILGANFNCTQNALKCILGAFENAPILHARAFGVHLGCIWRAAGVHFGCSWRAFWVHLACILGAFGVQFGCILGAFGVHFGCIWSGFRMHLGAFWVGLGCIWVYWGEF